GFAASKGLHQGGNSVASQLLVAKGYSAQARRACQDVTRLSRPPILECWHHSETRMPSSSPSSDTLEKTAYSKVTWRLIPFLFLCYVVAYLDRVNVGFAKLQMLTDLKFSDTVYGLGAGIFFIGYFLFEVPSNIILHRTGARVWIARIMVTWGVISSAMMFVT